MILEGESLVNDATALVIYRFAVAAVVGGSFSLLGPSPGFSSLSRAVRIAVGLAWGWIIARIQRALDESASPESRFP